MRKRKKHTRIEPPRRRRFAPVDLESLADDNENPDWLVGAN